MYVCKYGVTTYLKLSDLGIIDLQILNYIDNQYLYLQV
jgi:hypothetical protein